MRRVACEAAPNGFLPEAQGQKQQLSNASSIRQKQQLNNANNPVQQCNQLLMCEASCNSQLTHEADGRQVKACCRAQNTFYTTYS